MKKRLSDRTVKSLFDKPKKKVVEREDFKLVRTDSHMVHEAVPGYTVEIEGVHFLLEKALLRFPSLMITECKACRALKERAAQDRMIKPLELKSTLEHY